MNIIKLLATGGILAITANAAASADPVSPDDQRPKLAGRPASIVESFSVFKAKAGPADALPDGAADSLAAGPPAWLGINPALAKRVGDLWLVPGTDSLCLIQRLPKTGNLAVGCSDHLVDAASKGIVFSTNAGVAGAMPDGVNQVAVTASHGRARIASVRRNVFVSSVRQGLRVRFRLNGKTHSVAVPRR